ncbi:PEP-CTERM-box response regulator transcription factor [Enterovibrio paralichthyis]|uniref:PEP-CTERM-box response regulator transcription factor n=1 Tax=Enterovibrio paralichthyis TaxID=2853805 RepID=UPI001C474EDD|nr:PEP-CTERM-box response regulator transcription factor [Enterovibrio paralichthyis]MBV7299800.1 PEP-CTERM-box response regulator transcription factor [Enterovibrio paralichthyis]
MNKLLVIEDDVGIQKQLKWALSDFDVIFAKDRDTAISQLRRHSPCVVTLDLGLPPDAENASEGLAALEQMLALDPGCKVIVITGNEDKQNALKAIKLGAHDFYQKPINDEELTVIINRAFFVASIEEENAKQEIIDQEDSAIIGNSPEVMKVKSMINKVAPTELTTLLLGESGTGKDLVAREIHKRSKRHNKPFVAINCASIPENLLESELFGYEKGAFTGAHKTTPGKIECADGGTLFLDEIGDMSYPLQAKILRFLQDKVIERVGGRSSISVDIKIVCATNKNLREMVLDKTFREDLFYRISEIVIDIPPLRERGDDVIALSRVFLNEYSQQLSKKVSGYSDDAINALMAHDWPGNIRELQNKVKSAALMCEGKVINADDLMLAVSDEDDAQFELNLKTTREKAERAAIVKALSFCDGNLTSAAKHLGITRPTLYYLLDKYSLKQEG